VIGWRAFRRRVGYSFAAAVVVAAILELMLW
jgi:hypothetical protein